MARSKASDPSVAHLPSAEWLLVALPYVESPRLRRPRGECRAQFRKEPGTRTLLLVSGLALLAAPLGVLLQLGGYPRPDAWGGTRLGRRLDGAQKGMAFFAAYLEGIDRRRATERLMAEMRGRRTSG